MERRGKYPVFMPRETLYGTRVMSGQTTAARDNC
jgi:hypothetical protein